ncbi:g5724 [Coccomyxa elongata]
MMAVFRETDGGAEYAEWETVHGEAEGQKVYKFGQNFAAAAPPSGHDAGPENDNGDSSTHSSGLTDSSEDSPSSSEAATSSCEDNPMDISAEVLSTCQSMEECHMGT